MNRTPPRPPHKLHMLPREEDSDNSDDRVDSVYPGGSEAERYAALVRIQAEAIRGLKASVDVLVEGQKARDEEIFKIPVLVAHVDELTSTVRELTETVGHAPYALSMRDSQVGDLTKEQLEKLDEEARQGKGLANLVSKLMANQGRWAKRGAIGATVAAGAAGLLPELVKLIAGS